MKVSTNKDVYYPVYRVLSLILLLVGAFYFIDFIMFFILWNNWNQTETIINTAIF